MTLSDKALTKCIIFFYNIIKQNTKILMIKKYTKFFELSLVPHRQKTIVTIKNKRKNKYKETFEKTIKRSMIL